MKICSKCLVEKNNNQFAWRNKANNKRHAHCKQCNKIRDAKQYKLGLRKGSTVDQAKAIRKRNRDYLLDILKQSRCIDCDNNDVRVLEFDHIHSKSYSIGNMSSFSIERMRKEIEKCEIVCANCHRIRTYKRMNKCYRIY